MSEDKKFRQYKPRMTRAIVPADKLSHKLFNLTAEQYVHLMDGNAIQVAEDKKGKVLTPVWLKNAEGLLDKKPLTPFQREVIFTAISAYEQGYNVLTIHSTLNALTGSDKCRIYDDQYEAIKEAFYKGQGTLITIDSANLRKAFPKYDNKEVAVVISDYLLPCRIVEATYNGQKTLTIEMYAQSPLMIFARDIKQQVQKYDLKPIDVPNQRNTPLVIVIKHELRRWVDAVITRELNNTLTIPVFLKNIGHADADKFKQRKIRENMAAALNHFVDEGIITAWKWVKEGRAYRAITISYKSAQIQTKKVCRSMMII